MIVTPTLRRVGARINKIMGEFGGEQSNREEKLVEQPVEQEAGVQQEMPEDFEDPEGKAGKWKTVKGEVEIEGQKVEVSYREKVIDLPKHRQEETGIKRIRRRELLPPFPEGLYLVPEEKKARDVKRWEEFAREFPDVDLQGTKKRILESKLIPVYSSEKKFDHIYQLLTDNKYPSQNSLTHVIEYGYIGGDDSSEDWHRRNIKLFKREGLYFQEIYSESERRHESPYRERFYLNHGGVFHEADYTTPVFIFDSRNKRFIEYINSLENNDIRFGGKESILKSIPLEKSRNFEVEIPIVKNALRKPLRWCHAECALVPTKRSLNVLFFETGEEDKQEDNEK